MTEAVLSNIGELIGEARSQRGLSQEALAYKVGLEQTDISKIERGKEKPTAARAKMIAQALGLDETTYLVQP